MTVRLPAGKLVQIVLMDAVLVVGGIVLFMTTGEIGWMIAGVIGGAIVSMLLLVPALREAAKAKGGSLVD